MCRLDPIPDALQQALHGKAPIIEERLLCRGQFIMTGDLKAFDRTSALGGITAPTLLTCGRHDMCTPEATAWYQMMTPNAEISVFANSSHMAHLEEADRFLQVVRAFLHSAES